MALYNVKSKGQKFQITKFDDELEVEQTYEVVDGVCTCPAGQHGKFCRHKEMVPMFETSGRVDTSWFYDFNRSAWYQFDWQNGRLLTESQLKPKWRRI